MAAPCNESWPSWSRTRWRASRRTTEWALTVWSISEPGWAIEYMELDPSVRFSVMQLAHTRTDATPAAMDTGAYPASTSLARRWPAR